MKNTFQAIIMATLVIAFGIVAEAAPANDNWANATVLPMAFQGFANGTVTGATVQTCEPTHHVFPDEGTSFTNNTVWYKWQAPLTASFTFSFAEPATTIDPVVSAYRMSVNFCDGVLGPLPQRIIENHNYNHGFVTDSNSVITFRATAGEIIYIAVDSYGPGGGTFSLQWQKTRFKYDVQLDHKNSGADLVIARGSGLSLQWWTARYGTSNGFNTISSANYGNTSDMPLMADYDGDGISDRVAVRPSNGKLVWWISDKQGQIIKVVEFGLQSDSPVVGDYDADGIGDIAVTRGVNGLKVWHILRSSDGQYMSVQYGLAGDLEMTGDYDGDTKTDFVVLRPENGTFTWYIHQSYFNQIVTRKFGNVNEDVPQVADFDGDTRHDIAVFRRSSISNPAYAGYWFSINSNSGLPLDQRPTQYHQFGQADDMPQPADYDADGKTDLAVYRNGVWWIRNSRTGQTSMHHFGVSSDLPLTDGGMLNAQLNYY